MQQPVIRFDETSLVLLDHEREWVFCADPEGRMEMIHTPQVSLRRSRFNQWFETQKKPWPGLRETSIEQIVSAIPEWSDVWRKAWDCRPENSALRIILQEWIDRFLDFHARDAKVFSALFPKIPILPPDTYRALYVRIQEGCPWNRCAFCTFYKDERYRVLPQPELVRQLAMLRAYWSGAIRSRHGLFLGDANAVAVPPAVLAQRLDLIRKTFPQPELIAFHSFVDYFAGPVRSTEEWRALRERGLRRLSLGIESGNARLMEEVDKPANLQDVADLIRSIREAGITLNLIFLVGLGGHACREEHLEDSLLLIGNLGLSKSDRIYLSPLVIDPSQPYAAIANRENWGIMNEQELQSEVTVWQTSMRRSTIAQISPYHIRQFIY